MLQWSTGVFWTSVLPLKEHDIIHNLKTKLNKCVFVYIYPYLNVNAAVFQALTYTKAVCHGTYGGIVPYRSVCCYCVCTERTRSGLKWTHQTVAVPYICFFIWAWGTAPQTFPFFLSAMWPVWTIVALSWLLRQMLCVNGQPAQTPGFCFKQATVQVLCYALELPQQK